MFFDSDGGPNPSGWIGLIVAAAAAYYLMNYQTPMKELVQMDFINNYLLKNQVKEIVLTKDRRSESFNYRSEIEMHSGEKYYMILQNYENFLALLDMT